MYVQHYCCEHSETESVNLSICQMTEMEQAAREGLGMQNLPVPVSGNRDTRLDHLKKVVNCEKLLHRELYQDIQQKHQ